MALRSITVRLSRGQENHIVPAVNRWASFALIITAVNRWASFALIITAVNRWASFVLILRQAQDDMLPYGYQPSVATRLSHASALKIQRRQTDTTSWLCVDAR